MTNAASTPQDCVSSFIAAMLARDMVAALSLLTDDVVFFYSNGTSLWGKAAFEATMTANWKVISDYKYSTMDSIWLAQSEDSATVIYTFAWSGRVGGNEVKGDGRGTRVVQRGPKGWQICHEHISVGTWK
jgi:ketosteroid isomerase-like protein